MSPFHRHQIHIQKHIESAIRQQQFLKTWGNPTEQIIQAGRGDNAL